MLDGSPGQDRLTGNGAHNLDLLDTVPVAGTLLTDQDIAVSGVYYGIYETIDQLDEAVTSIPYQTEKGAISHMPRERDGNKQIADLTICHRQFSREKIQTLV